MPDFRRLFVPNGSYFFTVNLLERRGNRRLVDNIDTLREAVRKTKQERPFRIDAWVVLPEHVHMMLTLPPNDTDFSSRIRAIKIRFNRAIPATERRSETRVNNGERGIWQRRFWEHLIRDEGDFEKHFDYVHYNPVKHGHGTKVADWPYSTFHRCVEGGLYSPDWAGGDAVNVTIGERRSVEWNACGSALFVCRRVFNHVIRYVTPFGGTASVPPYELRHS
jgi:putative transposase